MANTIPFFMQNQGASYSELSSLNFTVGVVDKDDTNLSNSQINTLNAQGKTIFSYVDIGEAENFRDYWQSSWNSNPPSFLLPENPNWPGDFGVKFWDPNWQKVMINEVQSIAKAGYDGMFMDMSDTYKYQDVINAYNGSDGSIENAMANYIIKLSEAGKAINPDFKVVPNNGTGLLNNAALLKAIDGFNVEGGWSSSDNALLHKVTAQGKPVFAIDYSSSASGQEAFIAKAIAQGYVPFESNVALNGQIPNSDYTIADRLPDNWADSITGHGSAPDPTPTPTPTPIPTPTPTPSHSINGTEGNNVLIGSSGTDTIAGLGGNDKIYAGLGNDKADGGNGNDLLYGNGGNDILRGGNGHDMMRGGDGNDTLTGGSGNDTFVFNTGSGKDVVMDFAVHSKGGNDVIELTSSVYSSVSQVMGHISYSGGNAFVDLGHGSQVELMGVAKGSLTASDFHIA
jgi:uncharacterized protein (TIGR01370 family)